MQILSLWRSRFAYATALTFLIPLSALAQGQPAQPDAQPQTPEATAQQKPQQPDQLKITFGGIFNTWFQNQQNFTFGASEYDDRYVVQMLRFNLSAGYGDYVRAVTRVDIGQGWWGVDNENWRDDNSANPNASNRWSRKDTNYGPHVDHAFLEFRLPETPLVARMGRMYYGLGNKIILDSNYDGIQLEVNTGPGTFGLAWAKASEGAAALYDLDPAPGRADGRDADLLMASFGGKAGGLGYSLFGFHFNDRNDVPVYPLRLDYLLARFRPAISTLNAFGAAATYESKALGLRVEGEANYLFGTDDLERTNSGANQMLDINSGDLRGYNMYAKVTKSITPQVDAAVAFGLGSGDDDVTSGTGNVNHLKTMGFFYMTELWDDSVMPDEEGITPQGLGAPNVRGYRELENTTLGQVSLAFRPIPKWRTLASYALIRATEPVRGWVPGEGGVVTPDDFTDETSSDIGSEIDFLVGYAPYSRLDLALRGGYFMAEDASLLLVHGRTDIADKKNPWELKAEVTFRF